MYPRTHTNVNGTDFHVASKYRIIKPIGSGAYGIVVSAEDTTTGRRVAIKKVGNAFHDLVDAKRVLREIKLMRFFGAHENLVTLYDMEEPLTSSFEDLYILTELMETDLHRILYSKQKLTDDHHAYFIYQLLRAMKYMHSANVIHRDLKPSNILLNSNCDLRVCDYGLARGIDDKSPQPLTEYVVTRWYRAPEIMLACKAYTKAVDVWSIGCIFAEMLRRKPLFPGSDYMDQLRLIVSVVGSPSEEDMAFITSERARAFMAKQAGKPKQPWSTVCKKANPLALDLLDCMLQLNPAKRITVEEALRHPYLSTLHCPDDEPALPAPYDFSWEKGLKLEKAVLQRLMYDEVVAFKRGKGAGGGVAAATPCHHPLSAPPPHPTSSLPDDDMKMGGVVGATGVGRSSVDGGLTGQPAHHMHKVTPWPGSGTHAHAAVPPSLAEPRKGHHSGGSGTSGPSGGASSGGSGPTTTAFHATATSATCSQGHGSTGTDGVAAAMALDGSACKLDIGPGAVGMAGGLGGDPPVAKSMPTLGGLVQGLFGGMRL